MTVLDERSVRALAFAGLAGFASLHWAGLVAPRAAGSLLLAIVLVVVAVPARVPWRPGGAPARAAAALLAIAMAPAAALVLAGMPVRLLLPDRWDELGGGILSGLEALPGTRVPYGGDDPWVRTVIVAGGVLLVVLAGALALRGARARPVAATAVLAVAYAVPVVERQPSMPYADGALFALLAAALLWADRVRGPDAATAATLVGLATLAALAVAPRVDASRPWIDLERLAGGLERATTSTFRWEHSYGNLAWSRDGREVLRVHARRPSYWKAVALEAFDGVRWRQERGTDPSRPDSEIRGAAWRQDVRVEVRGMRTTQVVGAGTTLGVRGARPLIAEVTPGTFETIRLPLRRGDSYVARVYVPQPGVEALRAAGTAYPDFVRRQLAVAVPSRPGRPGPVVRLPPWGTGEPALTFRDGVRTTDGLAVLRRSAHRRLLELARRQRAASATPYDLVRRIEAFLQRDAIYTETPPRSRLPLDAFVFGRREGYCQQFSGAMALLLRLAGVPARVAAGFSPGGYDEDSATWIVRDLDAHSWVEVYFPRIGWVAFDPTPAAAPAGGRAAREETAAAGDLRGADEIGRGAAGDDGGGAAEGTGDGRPAWPVIAGGALLLVALAGGVTARRRRGRRDDRGLPPELAEVVRALERTGRSTRTGTTLQALERSLGRGPAAEHLRALRERRFGGADTALSPRHRAALRRELGEGLGARGRLRAWTAMPPRPKQLRAWPARPLQRRI